jgi:multicomponent Na+:H+ antiporter subunit C
MTLFVLFALTGGILFLLGLLAAAFRSRALEKLIALNISASGVFLFFVALAGRSDPPDPLLQAMVLTGIVVSVALTGLGALLIRRQMTEGVRDDR